MSDIKFSIDTFAEEQGAINDEYTGTVDRIIKHAKEFSLLTENDLEEVTKSLWLATADKYDPYKATVLILFTIRKFAEYYDVNFREVLRNASLFNLEDRLGLLHE